MSTYYIRNEDETVLGPYSLADVKTWIAEGRLGDGTEFSPDAVTWRYARDIPDLGGTAKAVTPPGAFPEPSVLIRQGANIQGPYRMSRIRGYVKQRRIQHYMLFSEDGIFWIGPEHVPGLLPKDYEPLPPPSQRTAVPADGDASVAYMPKGTPPPAPGEDIGSSTLVGFRLDEDGQATPAAAAAPPAKPTPPPMPGTPAPGPVLYHVRTNGHDVYGPCTEEVLRGWIEQGRVEASAEFSTDGRTWMPGTRMRALFPDRPQPPARRIPGGGAPADAPPSPSPRRRGRGRS